MVSHLKKDFDVVKVGHTTLADDVEQADLGDLGLGVGYFWYGLVCVNAQ